MDSVERRTAGDINSADLDFAGYHVPDQAYCELASKVTFVH